ncbi:fumarylacetoacetate hydrolase family protein [Aquabacterium sp.]|uniref:fumarylacetoacetate hydrolase family protein n=1 Tax=Aquabacterium sp. TaxID=1872578 RepID=UPI002C205369|nr:fumarylacetoacetate hydrolase family protein [Aquabacterium sp.]HSW05519.1 fumarylacetoacetate hydrolase family protein [Aquabacterium sp.]
MRLATRADGTRDGQLVLVDTAQQRCAAVPQIARTLQAALDDWPALAPRLHARQQALEATAWSGAERFDATACRAPLPRAYQWADASVYRNHARLIYQWRREPIPPRYEDEPLVYQGGSDVMLGPSEHIVARDEAHGIDLEAEIAVITTDVPMGTSAEAALDCIALVVLLNDVSLRGLIPAELARGFGFYQSKPASSFAPLALTTAALGEHWRGGMLHLPVHIELNGQWFGHPDAGQETVFHFGQILAHLARTRRLSAGSIVGAGTISNADPACGNACITEARVRQMLAGVPDEDLHPYLKHGDRVRLEVRDGQGHSLFGAIDQRVVVQSAMDE